MTNTNEDLAVRIEQMIAEHIAATRKAAQIAMDRAFATVSAQARQPTIAARAVRMRAPGKRRASAELEALGERFLGAVSRKPGETMTVLAADVGASARELNRAVSRLKQAGRVRAIGVRSQTRYFPVAANGAS
jgi:hypothetical protein